MAEENGGSRPAEQTQHSLNESNLSAAASHAQAGAREVMEQAGLDREGPSIATATLVGVGVALLEPELIPGMLIGAGALLAPKLIPALGGVLRPMVKGVVKAGYSAALTVREYAAEAGEQMEDIFAEARAEHGQQPGNGTPDQSPAPQEAPRRQRRRGNEGPVPATNL